MQAWLLIFLDIVSYNYPFSNLYSSMPDIQPIVYFWLWN